MVAGLSLAHGLLLTVLGLQLTIHYRLGVTLAELRQLNKRVSILETQ